MSHLCFYYACVFTLYYLNIPRFKQLLALNIRLQYHNCDWKGFNLDPKIFHVNLNLDVKVWLTWQKTLVFEVKHVETDFKDFYFICLKTTSIFDSFEINAFICFFFLMSHAEREKIVFLHNDTKWRKNHCSRNEYLLLTF